MENMNAEKRARILPFKKKKVESDTTQVTEVTRSIFSGTWNAYIDEPTNTAIKIDTGYIADNNPDPEESLNRFPLTLI